ncbi:hypothetical protein OG785_45535 [Streptomyces sp. NBC_00006]|uniref:hypothetical protein n=1 Tax=Streptomyces sp. NBC_00006 TaxID=2975619 RepID=UPI00224F070A|nr:hypothetical protein [Streptomyces sp. NBC_00006]MCX5537823.1 hypothetical protein [Streptomyces sp. NBC_00006]
MNQLPTPKRLAVLAAGTTAALGAVAGASHAAGAPDTLVAATAGALVVGAASIGAAVHGRPQEVQR